jgi:SHS2 domain-containing protein
VEGRGHRSIEHTADLAVELWAPDEPALLVEGARALVELLTEGAEVGATTERTAERMAERTLELTAIDPEDRLVRWLSEVLYWASMEGFLVVDAALELVGATGLRGTVRGQAGASELVRTEIKAVTYHDLRLERGPAGVRARVVFDV